MFTSCKKEDMLAPQTPESSSSFKTTTNDGSSTPPSDGVDAITVGSDVDDKTGSGTTKPTGRKPTGTGITIGSDVDDKTGSGTKGKKTLKARIS